MNDIQEQINALESRQLELRKLMAASDAHAAKCVKMNKKFSTEYPAEAEEYPSLNREYNNNEAALAELYVRLDEARSAAEEQTVED